jgi:RNA polymerase sigma-70 factor
VNEIETAFFDELHRRTGQAQPPDLEDVSDIGAIIAAAHAAAASAWAPVVLDGESYARHLAACAVALPPVTDLATALGSLHLTDLYLACAVGKGVPLAAAAFVRSFLQPIAGAVRAVDPAPAFVEDVRQALHERLLLSHEGPPRILQYGGRASLASWIGVAARRMALGLLRENDAHGRATDRAGEEPLPIELDAELRFLKDRYQSAFKNAVSAAITRLSQRERMIIRMHTVGGMTLARIAAMLDVDESTVSRWEKRAREAILAETHRELGTELGLEVKELPSLARLVTSQLDVSIARLLAEPGTAPR